MKIYSRIVAITKEQFALALILRDYERMSVRNIAGIMGVSDGYMGTVFTRGCRFGFEIFESKVVIVTGDSPITS